jgi:glycosyltransferase involved in cell wall biosynthesis
MAIQPTTLNHRYTTPQKLFEALAAGVPVVASDLPGMADIVRASDAGVLCDATSPDSIAAAIKEVLDQPPAELAAMRERASLAARETYNWDRQVTTLFELYGRLLGPRP